MIKEEDDDLSEDDRQRRYEEPRTIEENESLLSSAMESHYDPHAMRSGLGSHYYKHQNHHDQPVFSPKSIHPESFI